MSPGPRFNNTVAFVASIAAIAAVLIAGIVVIGTRSTPSASPAATSTTVLATTTTTRAPATTTTTTRLATITTTTTTVPPERITIGPDGEVVWEPGWSTDSQGYQCCFPGSPNLSDSAGCQGGAPSGNGYDPAEHAFYLDGREC